jgi:hypothetical protein
VSEVLVDGGHEEREDDGLGTVLEELAEEMISVVIPSDDREVLGDR